MAEENPNPVMEEKEEVQQTEEQTKVEENQNPTVEEKEEVKQTEETKIPHFTDSIQQGSLEDIAYGCVLGAFTGDACGSYNEFCTYVQGDQFMDDCMKMPGGGPFQLYSGQITDDSELASCILWAIIEQKKNENPNEFHVDRIAEYYGKWMKSPPFDIGITTENAMYGLVQNPKASVAYESAAVENQTSMSNGSLMRITPLAVYTCKLTPENAREVIDADVLLTHPNKACCDIIYMYCSSIHFLIKNADKPNRAQLAFDEAQKLVDSFEPYEYNGQKFTMGDWIRDAARLNEEALKSDKLVFDIPKDILNCRKLIGWLQRAIVLSYYYLLRHASYEKANENQETKHNLYYDAMRQTIKEGGDTDTNAAIVGGMIGALVGVHGLPKDMYTHTVEFDCDQNFAHGKGLFGIKRPNFLSQKQHLLKNMNEMIGMISEETIKVIK